MSRRNLGSFCASCTTISTLSLKLCGHQRSDDRRAADVLTVDGLHCRYGRVAAVRDLSIAVHRAELVVLIGANGAGKTTTLKAISGLLRPAAGKICFEGEDVTGCSPRRMLSLGVAHCPEGRRVFPYMSVHENLRMGCYLRSDG